MEIPSAKAGISERISPILLSRICFCVDFTIIYTPVTPMMRSRFLPRPALSIATSCLLIAAAGVTGCTAAFSGNAGGAPAYEQQLAEHLTEQGAVMYGAFWCPHCADQKALFNEAIDAVPYVECDPEGEKANPQLCQEKNIQGYPTWEINGEFYPGTRSLEDLATLSGFEEK